MKNGKKLRVCLNKVMKYIPLKYKFVATGRYLAKRVGEYFSILRVV